MIPGRTTYTYMHENEGENPSLRVLIQSSSFCLCSCLLLTRNLLILLVHPLSACIRSFTDSKFAYSLIPPCAGAYMSEESQSSSSAGKVGTSTPPGSSVRGSGLEDEGIPQRYRRKPITSQEMEYIEVRGIFFSEMQFTIHISLTRDLPSSTCMSSD